MEDLIHLNPVNLVRYQVPRIMVGVALTVLNRWCTRIKAGTLPLKAKTMTAFKQIIDAVGFGNKLPDGGLFFTLHFTQTL